jgi:hypothetical protein
VNPLEDQFRPEDVAEMDARFAAVLDEHRAANNHRTSGFVNWDVDEDLEDEGS